MIRIVLEHITAFFPASTEFHEPAKNKKELHQRILYRKCHGSKLDFSNMLDIFTDLLGILVHHIARKRHHDLLVVWDHGPELVRGGLHQEPLQHILCKAPLSLLLMESGSSELVRRTISLNSISIPVPTRTRKATLQSSLFWIRKFCFSVES